MSVYNWYIENKGWIMWHGFFFALALSVIVKGCANVDFVDPGLATEMMVLEYKANEGFVDGDPIEKLEEEEFEKNGYNFKYGVVDGVISFFSSN